MLQSKRPMSSQVAHTQPLHLTISDTDSGTCVGKRLNKMSGSRRRGLIRVSSPETWLLAHVRADSGKRWRAVWSRRMSARRVRYAHAAIMLGRLESEANGGCIWRPDGPAVSGRAFNEITANEGLAHERARHRLPQSKTKEKLRRRRGSDSVLEDSRPRGARVWRRGAASLSTRRLAANCQCTAPKSYGSDEAAHRQDKQGRDTSPKL